MVGIRRLTNHYTPRTNKTRLSRVRWTLAAAWPPWSVTSQNRVYLGTALVRRSSFMVNTTAAYAMVNDRLDSWRWQALHHRYLLHPCTHTTISKAKENRSPEDVPSPT